MFHRKPLSPAALCGAYIFALASVFVAHDCHAESKSKPSVCEDFRIFETEAERDGKRYTQALGACYDGKKPVLWTSWSIVELTDPDTGAKRRYAVGFR